MRRAAAGGKELAFALSASSISYNCQKNCKNVRALIQISKM
jgi:hypothetical protein